MYQVQDSWGDDPVEKKTVVKFDHVGTVPVHQTWNIKLSSVQTQDNLWEVLPFDSPTYDLVEVYKQESHSMGLNLQDGSRLYH